MKAIIVTVALLLLIVHIWLSRQLHNGPNEVTLTEAVQPILNDNFKGVSIQYVYLDGTLKGTVADAQTRSEAEQKAHELRPAGRIINQLKIADSPPSLFVELTNQRLSLVGTVPNEEIKQQIGKAAQQATSAEVNNQIKVNRQTQLAWLEQVPEFLTTFFSGAKTGQIEASGENLRLKRDLRTTTKKQTLLEAAQKLNLSVVDELSLIRDQPEKLLAVLDHGIITLSGRVPSESIKSNLTAQTKLSGFKIDNQLLVQEDVVDPRWQLDSFIGDFFSGLSNAELEIDPTMIRVNRKVDRMKHKLAWLEKAQAILPQASLIDEIQFPEGPDFDFGFNRDGDKIKMSGWIPSINLKNSIVSATKKNYPEFRTDAENLYIQPRVEMPEWGNAIPGYIGELPTWPGWSRFRLNEQGLDWDGMTDDAKRKFAFTPEWFKRDFPKLDVPALPASLPMTVLAVLKADQLTLTGSVPTETLKKSIANTASQSLPQVAINNQLQAAPATVIDPTWSEKVAPLLRAFLVAPPKNGELEITQKQLRLKRSLPDKKSKATLVAFAETLRDSDEFIDQLTVTPPIAKPTDPAKVLAIFKDNHLIITGNVDSNKMRNSIDAAANRALPKSKITNDLVVDSKKTKPPAWSESIAPLFDDFFASSQTTVELEIDDRKLRLHKQFASKSSKQTWENRAEKMLSTNQKFVNQLTFAETKPIASRPTKLRVLLQQNVVTLSGQVPSKEFQQSINKSALKAHPDAKVVNQIEVDPLVKLPAWDAQVSALIFDFFTGTQTAELEINSGQLRLKRQMPNAKSKAKWLDRAQKLMPGEDRIIDQLTIAKKVTTPIPKPEPKKVLELKNYAIYFDTSSTWINAEGQRKLMDAAKQLKELKDANRRLLVKGYADARGEEAANKLLSENRALSVVGFLTGVGVDRNLIDIVGVGESEAGTSYDKDRRAEVILVK